MNRTIAWVVLPAALAAVTAAAEERALPPLLQGVRIEQRLDVQVPPELKFRDESGREVALGDYFGSKPTVLVLVYFRCPKLCTEVLNGLTEAMEAMPLEAGREFQVVTVSFDPKDTPAAAAEKKKNYLARYGRPGAEEGWHFLTGEQESIEPLANTVGFYYRYDPVSNEYIHASAIMVLTPQGRIARYFYGISFSPRDLRLGLVEASQERIGSPVDAVLLFCYHYDPTTGKYTADVMRLVRVSGMAILVVLGVFFASLWWRGRREQTEPPTASA